MGSSGPSRPEAEGQGLGGLGVLITRPAHQARPLCELIRSSGGIPRVFPALEIRAPRDEPGVRALLQGLERFQLAVFVSPNAVRYGLEMVRAAGGFPAGVELAAVGEATARALREAGTPPAVVPARRYDSEALLASPRMQRVDGQRIVIFRGEGGRALLGDTLRRRGAKVAYAEVYRRICPDVQVDALVAGWHGIDVVTATSCEILDNLVQLFGGEHGSLLRQTPLLVVSRRIRTHAQTLGFRQVLQAQQATDTALLAALLDFKSRNRAP